MSFAIMSPTRSGATGVNWDAFSRVYEAFEGLRNSVTMKIVFSGDEDEIFSRRFGLFRCANSCATRSPTEYTIEAAGGCEWAMTGRPVAPSLAEAVIAFDSAQTPDAVPGFRFLSVFEDVAPTEHATLESEAKRLVLRIKEASELTTESIGPLAGVSRRTVQSWLAGSAISQRNEEKLRALAEAIETIAEHHTGSVRTVLLERVRGSIRIYDMLAEGRYAEAVARGTGKTASPRPAVYPSPRLPTTSLEAQVASIGTSPTPSIGPLDRRFVKRFRL
jgi:hypothetical protein